MSETRKPSGESDGPGCPVSAMRANDTPRTDAEISIHLEVLDGTSCAQEQADGNGPCGICTSCLRARLEQAEALLDQHRRFHNNVGCPGAECYVCDAEELALSPTDTIKE